MLDLHLAAMMAGLQAAGVPDLADLPLDAARGLYRQILAGGDVPPADVGVEDRVASGPAGDVPLRVYRPRTDGPHAIVVWYHGGGYVMGDVAGYDNVCRQLCEDSGAMVVSVDYRLAPEHAFHVLVDDAWAALCWIAAHAAELGGDATRIAVAGDSAGAVLAADVAMMARDEAPPAHGGAPRVVFQALLYPPSAGGRDGPYPSRATHAAGPTLTQRTCDYFFRMAFGASGPGDDWRAAPLHAPRLDGLPPTLLQVAAHDPLRDEAMAHGEALLAAGVDVAIVEYHGLAHGFVSMGGALPAARLAQRQLAQALRTALAIRRGLSVPR